jgi:hypothetical protein
MREDMTMSRISKLSALLLGWLAVSAACAKNQSSNANAPGSMMRIGVANHQTMGPATLGTIGVGDFCPTAVPDTNAQATDTADGIAMTFTTSGDVQELRTRVRAMADGMDERSDATRTGDPESRRAMGGGTPRNADGPMPATHARAEDVTGGARIVMRPVDPSQTEEWRRRVWDSVLDVTAGRICPTACRGESA